MDSFSGLQRVTFYTLKARLIRFVTYRISNGEFSERGLARLLRVSQPQLHKVLKGHRKFTPELADRVLVCFGISVLDLLEPSDWPANPQTQSHLEQQDIPKKQPQSQSITGKFGTEKTA